MRRQTRRGVREGTPDGPDDISRYLNRECVMHVYLRDQPVHLKMIAADADGLAPSDSELVPMAFFVEGNEAPSFRALLPRTPCRFCARRSRSR